MTNTVVTHREMELHRKLEALRDGMGEALEAMLEAFRQAQEREVALGEQLVAVRADVVRLTRERDDARREHDEEHAARESLEGDLDVAMCARNEAVDAHQETLNGVLEVQALLREGDQTAPGGNVEVREALVGAALQKLEALVEAARE